MRFKDLTGKRFGRLLVIGVDHRRISSGRQVPYFKCDRLFRYQWSVQRALTNPIRK